MATASSSISNTSSHSLEGKVAVITGAGRGIGQAMAKRFAHAGADIAICARTSEDLNDTKQLVEATGRRCLTGIVDLAEPDSTRTFCESVIRTFGKVSIIVNNAGAYLERGTVAESDPDDWWTTVEVNVRGPYMMVRYLLENMEEGGRILNLSSGKGLSPG